MSIFKHRVHCVTACAVAILMTSCSATMPNQAGGTSAGSSVTGIGNLTGGAEAQPTASPGVTPGSTPVGIGNLTGGSEARPTADPGVTPGTQRGK